MVERPWGGVRGTLGPTSRAAGVVRHAGIPTPRGVTAPTTPGTGGPASEILPNVLSSQKTKVHGM